MLVGASQQSTASVTGAIQKAARLTGADFHYLLATAKVESNLNPRAAAATSSAGGLFQFIEQTWFGTLKEAGGLLGYGHYANAITRTSSGRYEVADPAMRAEILQLRQDPTANALMAGVLTRSNTIVLGQKLGRAPTESELYIAHFMGVSGAARLIGQAENNPGARAADLFPGAARANRSIFFDRDGRARNFVEVTNRLAGRYEVARAGRAAGTVVAAAGTYPAETARAARSYQAAAPETGLQARPGARAASTDNAGFAYQNLYRASERRQAIAPAVTDLWSQAQANVARVRAQASATVAAAPAAAAAEPQTQQAVAQAPDTRGQSLGWFQDFRPNARSLFTGG